MPNPSLPWLVALSILLAAASARAEPSGGEPIDVAGVDYCDPRLDVSALLADPGLSVEKVAAPQKKLAEARRKLVEAGSGLAALAGGPTACRQVLEAGRAQFAEALSRNTRRLRREARSKPSRDAAIAQVQARLGAQWLNDQAGRMTYLAFLPARDSGGAGSFAYHLATVHIVGMDVRSAALMQELLETYDWIDAVRFGAKASRQAWLLVQHADHDPAFQRLALARMAAHLESGGVRARDYAYLFDRVAVNTGQLQRYGTQPAASCNDDGSLDLRPVEDPAGLDERRRAMGLGPSAEQLAQEAEQRCRH